MIGIERIKIIGNEDWKGDYQEKNRKIEPYANALYPELFSNIKMPLAGSEVGSIECTKEEVMSRYDWQEGIDVILHFADGTKATMQEKFLTYHVSTMTFETEKSSGKKGAWFYCTAQYYFVGYAKNYYSDDPDFTDWMLINLPLLHQIDMQTVLPWEGNANSKHGRKAKFKYLKFKNVPSSAILSDYQSHIANLF